LKDAISTSPSNLLKTASFVFIILTLLISSSGLAQSDAESPDTLALDTAFSEQLTDSALALLTPGRVTDLEAHDTPDDHGKSITLSWSISPDDSLGGLVMEYDVLRSASREGPFERVGGGTRGNSQFSDNSTETSVDYYYQVEALNYEPSDDGFAWQVSSLSETTGPAQSKAQWFNMSRLNTFVGIFILCGAIIFFIVVAKRGKDLYIRKIAGIEEVENAVGRATEMGRAIYYVPGISDMDDVQTLASLSILGRVAEIAAENGTRIDVPVCRSMVMVTANEVVREAYSKVGRPDAFQDDQVRYLTDDQFGYAAAIDGLFVREKPATVFLIGAFFAESLIMAETGNSIGAIQIAGTAMPSQLPFFVAACDYTLIGEELFAASAYLSRDAKLLGSLKGQDVGKAVFLAAILFGIILESFGIDVSSLFSVR
jgi:hypothetical protein